MSLFNSSEIESVVLEKQIDYNTIKSKVKQHNGFEIDLSKEFPSFEMGNVIEFVTHGRWSIHQIVQHIIKTTGKVDVYIATWTITEEPLRVLHKLKQSGLIAALYCLFDNRIKERTPKSYQFCSQFADRIGLAKSHAKVTVLENEDWQITINSSMNWSKNPRTESGVVVCSRASAIFHKDWITTKIDDNQRANNRS